MKSSCSVALLAGSLLLAGLTPTSAQREGPWCAHIGIGDDSYVEKCDMLSYEMCRTEIFAQGGAFCTQNPRYRQTSTEPKQRQRKAKKRKPDQGGRT